LAYPNGSISQITSYQYYLHASLAGSAQCAALLSDSAYLAAAASVLTTASSAQFADTEARLRAPFVDITFAPPLSNTYDITSSPQVKEFLSLRRRFTLSGDKKLVLLTRAYASRRSGNCDAGWLDKHDSMFKGAYDRTRFFANFCDAIVVNRSGAGVCLRAAPDGAGGRKAEIVYAPSSLWVTANKALFTWTKADSFVWRTLGRPNHSVVTGGLELFSPKCYGAATCTGGNKDILFLPDRTLYGY